MIYGILQVKPLSNRENTSSGYLDHAFMPHCTIFPYLRAQQEAITNCWTWPHHQMHFCATLLILVLEILFNFQIDVLCTEKFISKITFNIRWNLEQIWHSWHTWVSSKGSRTMGSEWPDKHDKTRFATWAGVGKSFSHGHPPQLHSVGSSVDWVMGLFSLWKYHGTN